MKPLIIEEGAELEFEEAAERYDAEDPAVANGFVDAVLAVIESLHRSPGEWPLAPTVPDRFGVRRRLVPGFAPRLRAFWRMKVTMDDGTVAEAGGG